MKVKSAGREGWPRCETSQETVLPVPGGFIVDFLAGEVIRPLDVGFRGRTLRILDTDFRWVHYAPTSENHALTVQINAAGVPVQIYVDICDGHGLDEKGVPYTHDLYLDVLGVCEVQSDGTWHVLDTEIIDQTDLDDALTAGKVTQAQFELAWAEARRVEIALREQCFEPLRVVQAYLTTPYT